MLKKVVIVAGLTGVGHILSASIVPVAVRYLDESDVAYLSVVDSSIALIAAIVAFGLQLTTTRDIATNIDWRDSLNSTQSARATMSVLILSFGCMAYYFNGSNAYLLPLLLAPLIALNVDFALYGRGLAIQAGIASFVRVSLPVGLFIVLMRLGVVSSVYPYVAIVAFFLLLSGLFVTRTLGVPYFQPLGLSYLRKYKDSIFVGLSSLVLTLNRFGSIYLASLILPEREAVIYYGMVKLHLLFIGVKRLFIQTYYKDLLKEKFATTIDALIFVIGVCLAAILFTYSEHIEILVFNSRDPNTALSIHVLAVIVLFVSIYATADSRLLLKRLDARYVKTTLLSGVVMLFAVSAGYAANRAFEGFLAGLLLSELSLAVMFKYSLQKRGE